VASSSSPISGDRRPDDVRLSDIAPRFVCTNCGKRGVAVWLNFRLRQEVGRVLMFRQQP